MLICPHRRIVAYQGSARGTPPTGSTMPASLCRCPATLAATGTEEMARNSLRVIIGDLWFAFDARLRRSRLAPQSSRRRLPLQSGLEDAERTRNRRGESALYDTTCRSSRSQNVCRRPLNACALSQNGACAALGIIATSACARLALCWSTTEGLTIGSRHHAQSAQSCRASAGDRRCRTSARGAPGGQRMGPRCYTPA